MDLTNEEWPFPVASFAGDWVITVGTASKSHWGGPRIGWIRATEELISGLACVRVGMDLGSPVFEQLVLAELRPAPSRCTSAGNRCADSGTRWSKRFGSTARSGSSRYQAAGCRCRLPEAMSARLAVAPAGHGVSFVPGLRLGMNDALERWLRLPFAQPADRLEEAVRRLATAAASVRRAPGADWVVT